MARRNSPNDIRQLADLNQLSEIVVDKRLGKRAEAKKSRRNRHYEKQFIKMHYLPAWRAIKARRRLAT